MVYININLFKGNEEEQWRPVEGFPDYMVSDQGRVKSLKFGREKILKQHLSNSGYLVVYLRKNGKTHRLYVHRLVLEAFIGKPEDGLECNHRNGAKTDNRLENLEWVTPSENMKHAFRTGLNSNIGETHYRAKLSESDVLEILDLLDAGMTQQKIAERFNINQQTVSKIKTGRRWSHLTGRNPDSENPESESTPITINLNFWFKREAI